MPQFSPSKRLTGLATLSLCLLAGLAGCAQGGRSTMGGPGDPAATQEQERQRARGSLHPVPPGQNLPGGGEASGGSGGGSGEGGTGQ